MRGIVQILVVGFLVLCAAGLVLVGVFRVRETANQNRCMHNLMQIGKSLRDYSDQKQSLPPGTVPNPDLPPEKRLSWQFETLPYPGKHDVYRCIDQAKPWDADENRTGVNTLVVTFLCPANFSGLPPDTPAPTHYVGIAGVGRDAATLPLKDPKAGFFGYDRVVKWNDAQRGVSHTIVAMETAFENGPWAAGGWPTVRGFDPERPPHLGPGRPFGGIHPGGANTLFADLSVQFIADSINPRTLEEMATLSVATD